MWCACEGGDRGVKPARFSCPAFPTQPFVMLLPPRIIFSFPPPALSVISLLPLSALVPFRTPILPGCHPLSPLPTAQRSSFYKPEDLHVPLTSVCLEGHFFQQAYPKGTFTLTKPRSHTSHDGTQEREQFLQFNTVHSPGDKKRPCWFSLVVKTGFAMAFWGLFVNITRGD